MFEIKIPLKKISNKNVILIKYPFVSCFQPFDEYYIIDNINKPFSLKAMCNNNNSPGAYATAFGYKHKKNDIVFANGKKIIFNRKKNLITQNTKKKL